MSFEKRVSDLETGLSECKLRLTQIERSIRNESSEQELSGTSHPTADSELKLVHSLGRVPNKIMIVKGDVYIKDFDQRYIDIRSRQSSQNFKIIVS